MKSTLLTTVFVLIILFTGVSVAEEKQNAAFDRFKFLEGTWVGEWAGRPSKEVSASFRLISGGTSLLQTVSDFHGEMVTTYYPDGNHLMLTHYCNANNQPRLRSEASPSEKMISFSFQDATNMANATEGHIEKMVFTFQDPDHIRQDWTWSEGGEIRTDSLSFKRVK